MPFSSKRARVLGMYFRSSLRTSSARMKTKLGLAGLSWIIVGLSSPQALAKGTKGTTPRATEANNNTTLLLAQVLSDKASIKGLFPLPPERLAKASKETATSDGNRRRSGSQLDRRGGTENLTRTAFAPHGDVRLGGARQHGRLESVPGDRAHGL